jgi:hypothetical protein
MWTAAWFVLLGQVSPDSGTPAQGKLEDVKARAAAVLALANDVAKRYDVYADDGRKVKMVLQPDAVLQWSNPVLGEFYGGVFVWTDKGCPRTVASIYRVYSPENHTDVELHSLSRGRVIADRGDRQVWAPTRGGVDWKPIAEAPAPAATPVLRLRQLRALAQEFAAEETDRKGERHTLRLLTQPVFRAQSTDPDVLDGALFCFVQGTDPEALLVIEAHQAEGRPRWEYAFARMNSVKLKASHRNHEVWSVPEISYNDAKQTSEPYTLFMNLPKQ